MLGCDTVVEIDGALLGKPADEADARAMLAQLAGREHRVATGEVIRCRDLHRYVGLDRGASVVVREHADVLRRHVHRPPEGR